MPAIDDIRGSDPVDAYALRMADWQKRQPSTLGESFEPLEYGPRISHLLRESVTNSIRLDHVDLSVNNLER